MTATWPTSSAGGRCIAPAEHGAAGLTLVLGTVLAVVVALAAVTAVADLAVTSARARTAADAAALAAVGASPLAGGAHPLGAHPDPRAQAQRLAAANGAQIVAVRTAGWPLRYGVTVTVAPSTRWVRELVGSVRAGAVAALRPQRPDPRGPG